MLVVTILMTHSGAAIPLSLGSELFRIIVSL